MLHIGRMQAYYSRLTSLYIWSPNQMQKSDRLQLNCSICFFPIFSKQTKKEAKFLFHSRDPEGTISSSWIPFKAYSQQANKREISSSLSLFLSPPAQNNRFDRKKPSAASYSIGRTRFLMN